MGVGGLVVSMLDLQASDPGSIPGRSDTHTRPWHNGRVLDSDREDPGSIPDCVMCKILGQDSNSVCASVHPAVKWVPGGTRWLKNELKLRYKAALYSPWGDEMAGV